VSEDPPLEPVHGRCGVRTRREESLEGVTLFALTADHHNKIEQSFYYKKHLSQRFTALRTLAALNFFIVPLT